MGEFRNGINGKSCYVFGSNLQVVFPFKNEKKGKDDVVVLPDVSIVCDTSKLHNKRCYGAPDLVVEVLSPSTGRNDRLLKRNYYEKAGVKEYLIVLLIFKINILKKTFFMKMCLSWKKSIPMKINRSFPHTFQT